MKKLLPHMIKKISLNLLIAIVFAFFGYVYGRISVWYEYGEQVPNLPDIRRLARENQALLRELERLDPQQKLSKPKPSRPTKPRPKPTDNKIYTYAESQFKKLDSKTDYKRATLLNDFDAIDRMEEKVLRDIASHFGISEMEVQQARVRGSRR